MYGKRDEECSNGPSLYPSFSIFSWFKILQSVWVLKPPLFEKPVVHGDVIDEVVNLFKVQLTSALVPDDKFPPGHGDVHITQDIFPVNSSVMLDGPLSIPQDALFCKRVEPRGYEPTAQTKVCVHMQRILAHLPLCGAMKQARSLEHFELLQKPLPEN